MKSASTNSGPGANGIAAGQGGKAPNLLHALGSVRLAVALFSLLIAISVLGTWIAQQDTSAVALERLYSPEVIYFMKLAGLTDIFRSGWFVCVLSFLALNLLCAVWVNFGAAWKAALTRVPSAINVAQALSSRGADRYAGIELPSPIGREQFREFVQSWCRGRLGRTHAVRDQGGTHELQMVAQEGRFSKLSLHLSHLAVLLLLGGAALGSLTGFEGRLDLDEGARVPYIQVTRGSNQNWPGLQQFGQIFPGFYEPGFEVECSRFDVERYPLADRVKSLRSWLNFYREGKLVASREISVNTPATFEGMRFFQAGYVKSGKLRAGITVLDRLPPDQGDDGAASAPSESQQFARVLTGRAYPIDGGVFKVLQIEESGGERGPAARVEYIPEDGAPETFWIFQRFPKYDEVNRRASRHVFILDALSEGYGTSIYVAGDPGRPWVWAGGILLIITLLYSLLFAHNRYWFVWKPGKVYVVGTSSKPMFFEPRFERAMESFRARIARAAPRADAAASTETTRTGRGKAARASKSAKPAPETGSEREVP